MFAKRSRGYDPNEAPAAKRLRHNLTDLFLAYEIAGDRTASLLRDAVDAGAQHVEDLSRAGASGRRGGNVARDLRARLLRRSQWSKPYEIQIPTWDTKLCRRHLTWLPVLLPHEILHCLLPFADRQVMLSRANMAPNSQRHMAKAAQELGVAADELVGLGMWGDGIASKWNKTESLEVLTLSLPGLPRQLRHLRIPLCGLSKKFVLKHETFDAILEVLVWSLRACAIGVFPARRHDDSDWRASDAARKKLARSDIGIRAVLCEFRGDWAWYKSVLRLPAWNEKAGCCWRCTATPADIRDCSSNAAWRTQELSHWQLLERIRRQGNEISPIFGAPGFRSTCIQVDWMHVADLGVSQDFLGSHFLLLLTKLPGNNTNERVGALFREVQAYCAQHQVESRLDYLTYPMIRAPGKKTRLRGSAAEIRALVPFAEQAARAHLDDNDPEEAAAKQCAIELHCCYKALSTQSEENPGLLKEHSRRFALLLVALEKCTDNQRWNIKPKLHLWQEMNERDEAKPVLAWTTRDEDFGGSAGTLARRRGGSHNATSVGRQLLLHFLGRYRVPSLR